MTAAVASDLYAQALADVRAIRHLGTYEPQAAKPAKLPPTLGPKCGSNAGYRQHLNRGETACDGCRAAHAEAGRRAGLT
ncbi:MULTISPECIES: hypothetical protein [unclassified Streptomyces]|uniref:hypothetical protein n=1 Tax=unclassified Streptomyces TaxID=2593676 RepID=UPI00037D4118|nr:MULTISPECIES: hypothetical protein [unclassified Streptomyces]MYX36748.1 hypothetical protein [Streptomyces sp. SID8377]